MWEDYVVAKVLNWFIRSPNLEVVNHSEDGFYKACLLHVQSCKAQKYLHKEGLQRFLSNFVVQEGDEQRLQQSTVSLGEYSVPKSHTA
jgi:hypothetical protein